MYSYFDIAETEKKDTNIHQQGSTLQSMKDIRTKSVTEKMFITGHELEEKGYV